MPKGQQLVDRLGPADGVFVDGDELFIVFPPHNELTRLHGFNEQDIADAVEKQLLGKASYTIRGNEVYMKTVKAK